jgi:hypothetical protein
MSVGGKLEVLGNRIDSIALPKQRLPPPFNEKSRIKRLGFNVNNLLLLSFSFFSLSPPFAAQRAEIQLQSASTTLCSTVQSCSGQNTNEK